MRVLLLAAVLTMATVPAFAVSGYTVESPDLEAAQAKLQPEPVVAGAGSWMMRSIQSLT
jgi:hypothetical protein